MEGGKVGYLSREDARRYAPILHAVAERDWMGWTAGTVSWFYDEGRLIAGARLDLGEPEFLVPCNDPPPVSYAFLPEGKKLAILDTDLHSSTIGELLGDWMLAAGYVGLERVDDGKRKPFLRVLLGEQEVGRLSPQSSGPVMPLVDELAKLGKRAVARGYFEGNRLKAEGHVNVAKATGLSNAQISEILG